jgi:hypothetical protein
MPLLVVGQSHVAAIRAAAKTHREAFPDQPRTRVIHTLEAAHAPELVGVAGGDYGAAAFGPKLRVAIEDQIARHAPRIVSVIGGNVHNALALVRNARPYDFLLAGDDGPPSDEGAELIPAALIRATLLRKLQPDFARLRALHAVTGPFLHAESPPPVRDDAYIAARAEAWFRDGSQGGIAVAGAGLRWRMWRLTSLLLRDAVEAMGCGFVPVPASVQDPDGFLRLDCAADPTHGNEAYGEAMIRAIEDSDCPALDLARS